MSVTSWLEDTFCTGEFIWHYDQQWNTTIPEFSRCFLKTVPVWAPALLLWLVAPVQAILHLRSYLSSRCLPIPLNLYNVARLSTVLALILVNCIQFGYDAKYFIYHSHELPRHNSTADLSSSVVNILTFVLFAFLLNQHRLSGLHTSALAWNFTFFNLVASLPVIYMLSMFFWNKATFKLYFPSFESLFYLVHLSLLAILFILTCFADEKIDAIEVGNESANERPFPEEKASFLSKHTYWWLNPLAALGFKKTLILEDLWHVSRKDKVEQLLGRFERIWQMQVDATGGKTPNVLNVLIRTYGCTYLYACLFQGINVCLVFVAPQILKLLIGFVSQPNEPLWHGFFLATLLFLVYTFNSLVFVFFIRMILYIGNQARITLIAAVYKKALTLSSAAKRHATQGQIINLMSVDSRQLLYLTTSIDDLWAAPIQIILATVFLWFELGASALAGIGAMALLMPINWWITRIEQKAVKRQMKIKDERINVTTEVLNGIRVIKLYGWELPFIEKIGNIRSKETVELKKIALLNALTSFVWNLAPFLVSFVTFGVYVLSSSEHILDAKKAFISLSLFEIMRFPLGALPNVINRMVICAASVRRLNRFFAAADLDDYISREVSDCSEEIVLENASFTWGQAEPAVLENEKKEDKRQTPSSSTLEKPTVVLSGLNLRVKKGSLVAIVGQVGSGKSSLLSALLGEMELLNGKVNISPDVSIAYVSQQAWIRNATLRENILFGCEYNSVKYNRILDMCALRPDLEILPGGDQTEIGEKGINLSGGQKQRLAVARACYAPSDLILLDDPLSAVDSHVAKHMFHQVIDNTTGYLRDKTRVLVTNSVSVLPDVDQIVVLVKGQISEIGTYQELIESNGKFADFIRDHGKTVHNGESAEKKEAANEREDESKDDEKEDILIEEEKAEEGKVKWSVYANYFRSLNYFWLACILFFWILMQLAEVGSGLWLAVWSNDPVDGNSTDPSQATISLRNKRLAVYGLLGFGQNVFYFIGWIALAIGSANSSITLHRLLLKRIMRSPMQFFDTTPMGRIINRFSKDMATIDSDMKFSLEGWLVCLFRMVSVFVLIIVQIPMLSIVIAFVFILFYFIQRYYIATYRQLSRLDSVTTSPIFSHFGETLSGVSCIRAFKHQERFIEESNRKIDDSQRTWLSTILTNRWLGVRMELCGNLIVLFAAIFAVIYKDTFQDKPGFVGLIIMYAFTSTDYLKWLVRNSCEMETSVVSVERIGEYCQLPTERDWDRAVNQDPQLPDNWPEKGAIRFEDYSVRYREGLDPVLRNITLDVKAGEKVGIVGRTGAGKSSLTLALFRILEAAEGRILIDDIEISRLGLHELRSKLSIIPQDPILFSGTIRSNLDPLSLKSDNELWRALEHCHLKSTVSGLGQGLDAPVAENGTNLSVGERQLICLGRALLRETRILVLDEATAAVDLATDGLVQATISEHLGHCTLLTIAHRLHTVRHSDRILALDQGAIAEFDTPDALIANPDSLFHSLAKDAGIE